MRYNESRAEMCLILPPPHPRLLVALWRWAAGWCKQASAAVICLCVWSERWGCWMRVESFWNLIHWLMDWIGWADAHWKEECVGDVCLQLSAAWSILTGGGQRSPANMHRYTIQNFSVFMSVLKRHACFYEGSSLPVHCLCVRVTLPQWSGSFLVLHSLLWK